MKSSRLKKDKKNEGNISKDVKKSFWTKKKK